VKVTPLAAATSGRLRDTLLGHGWDLAQATAAAEGTESGAVHATGLDPATVERLVLYAGGKLGLEVLTGTDWAIIGGSRARLSTLARPWGGPPELADVAHAVGMALPAVLSPTWTVANRSFSLDKPLLIGILNVTPDSFSDGGRYTDLAAAIDHAQDLVEAGADMVDIGGESTRPGRPQSVTASEELERVLPVVAALRERLPDTPLSVDTVKAEVAEQCLDGGVSVINDVSGGRLDPDIPAVVAGAGAGLVLMHSRGGVSDMATYDHTEYHDLLNEIIAELAEGIGRAVSAGVSEDRIVVDPGLGFAKRVRQSWWLLDQLEALTCLGRPIMVGPSRKRFLGAATGRPVDARDGATAAACALAYDRGARLFRVHDPGSARDALAVAHATSEPASVPE
jgi:dihydropteroate synthase